MFSPYAPRFRFTLFAGLLCGSLFVSAAAPTPARAQPTDVESAEDHDAELHGVGLPTLEGDSKATNKEDTLQLMDVDQETGEQGEFLATIMSAAAELDNLIEKAQLADKQQPGPEKLKAMGDVVEGLVNLLMELGELDEDLQDNDIFQKYKRIYERVQEAKSKKDLIQQRVRTIKDAVFDLTPEQIRQEVSQAFQAYLLSEFFAALEKEFGITSHDVAALAEFWSYLRDPALFADSFLKKELATWIAGAKTKYDVSDDATIELKVTLAPGSNIRLFSQHEADVGLRFVMMYAASKEANFGGLEVVAEGLSFRYRQGGKYSVEFNPKINHRESTKRSVIRNVDHWIDKFIAKLGLPITIDVTKYPFDNGSKDPFLECSISLDLTKMAGDSDNGKMEAKSSAKSTASGEGSGDDSIPVVITAEHIRLYADRVDWQDTIFRGRYKEMVEIYAGVCFWEMGGYAKPGKDEFGPTCKLGYMTVKPEVAHIRICASTQVPNQFNVINHCGGLYIFDQKISHFVGHTDFGTGRAWGKYFRGRHLEFRTETITDEQGREVEQYVLGPADSEVRLSVEAGKYFFDEEECCGRVKDTSKLRYKEGEFLYENGKLTMTGKVDLFGQEVTKLSSTLDFKKQKGRLDISHGLRIFGKDVSPTFFGEIDLRENRFSFHTTQAVHIPGLHMIGDPNIAVSVYGEGAVSDDSYGPPVPSRLIVRWTAMGDNGQFEVESLNDLTPERLRKDVEQHLDQMLLNGRYAAKKWATDKSALADKWERHWVQTLDRELGSRWKFGSGNDQLDKLLGDISKQAKQSADDVVDKQKKQVKGVIDRLTGKTKKNGDSPPSAEELRRVEMERQFDDRVANLLQEITGGRFVKRSTPTSELTDRGRSYRTKELEAWFEYSVAASDGDGNGDIGLLVQVSGFEVDFDAELSSQRRKFASAVVPATISFRSLVGDSQRRPTARISVGQFDDPSQQKAHMRVRHYLQELVELNLPDVQIVGRRKLVEKRLAIHNPHNDSLVVHVQLSNRHVQNKECRWSWDPSEGESYQFRIPGKTSRPMLLDYSQSVFETAKAGFVHGRQAKIRIESQHGRKWSDQLNVWLVKPEPELDGDRAYDDEDMRTHIYTVPNPTGPSIFSERLLALRNATLEPLQVKLRFYSNRGLTPAWHDARAFTIKAGATFRPLTEDGNQVQASKIGYSVQGASYQFLRKEPARLVSGSLGNGTYESDHIGTCQVTFQSKSTGQAVKKPADPASINVPVTPNLIRIPSIGMHDSATAIVQRVRSRGLQVEMSAKTLPSDKIVGLWPKSGEWVAPKNAVKLLIRRRIPDVVDTADNSCGAAINTLRQLGFKATPHQELPSGFQYRSSDTVFEQLPKAGTYATLHSKVQLTVKRRLPNLQRKSVANATKLIRSSGFRMALPNGTYDDDQIEDQNPRAFTGYRKNYAYPGDEIAVVKVLTPVPDLQSNSLTTARSLAEAKKVLADAGLRLETTGPYPSAKILSQNPPARSLVNRKEAVVTVTLATRVPSVTGKTVRRVTQEMRQAGLKIAETSIGDHLLEVDRCEVIGKTHRVGEQLYCKLGSTVRLDTGFRVPALPANTTVDGAIDILHAKGIRVDDVGTFIKLQEDVAIVVATRPGAGQRIDRHEAKVDLEVVVPVPPLKNLTYDEAQEKLMLLDLRWRAIGEGQLYGDARHDDIVLSVEGLPPSGYVSPETAVSLRLGRRVRSLEGLAWSDALDELADLRMPWRATQPVKSPTHLLRQLPAPAPDTMVDLTKGLGLQPGYLVPSVVDWEINDATQALQKRGLRLQVRDPVIESTDDAGLWNRTFIYDQRDINAILPYGSHVEALAVRYVRPQQETPQPQPLVTRTVLSPAQAHRIGLRAVSHVIELTIAPDRNSAQVRRVEHGAVREDSRYKRTGTGRHAKTGEILLFLEGEFQIQVPADGNGLGVISFDGAVEAVFK